MAKVIAFGGTTEKRRLARNATRWAIENELYIRENVRINIRFQDTKGEFFGQAIYNAPSSFRSKSFTITVSDNIDIVEELDIFLETVLHELVHVWQMAGRSTRYTLNNNKTAYKTFWHGEDMSNVPYSQQPWERQAYRMEKTLASKFLQA
jgi:hypothetical protein